MIVREIRKLLPEADVYTLEPDAPHLIMLKRTSVNKTTVAFLLEALRRDGAKATIVVVENPDEAVRILKLA